MEMAQVTEILEKDIQKKERKKRKRKRIISMELELVQDPSRITMYLRVAHMPEGVAQTAILRRSRRMFNVRPPS